MEKMLKKVVLYDEKKKQSIWSQKTCSNYLYYPG